MTFKLNKNQMLIEAVEHYIHSMKQDNCNQAAIDVYTELLNELEEEKKEEEDKIKGMTVAELIEKLQKYPQELEVTITDGYKTNFYRGLFCIDIFEDVDGRKMVDIGIGGFDND